jgi:hypothetical protein
MCSVRTEEHSMTACEAATRLPIPPRSPRRPHGATFVAALYVALVLGAPGIIRFAPDPETRRLSAVTAPRPQMHCAATASAPSPCLPFTMAVAGSAAPAH